MKTKPKVGYIGLTLELYADIVPDAIKDYQAFHRSLVDILGNYAEVVAAPFCYTEDTVNAAVHECERLDVDTIIITPLSYSPSLVSIPTLAQTRQPLLIWNAQKLKEITDSYGGKELMENHGMHGSQDLANVLRRARKAYGIVSGHYQDKEMLAELDAWVRAAAAAREASQITVGQFGPVFQGMGDFGIDETMMRLSWGPAVRRIPTWELSKAMAEIEKDEAKRIDDEIAADKKRFAFEAGISEADIKHNVLLGLAMEDCLEKFNCRACTMNFLAFGQEGAPSTAPFYGVNKLMAKGYGYAGEGNVTIAALVRQLHVLTGQAAFTEMFTADYANDQILMNHMGEGNPALSAEGHKPPVRAIPFIFGGPKGSNYLTHLFDMRPGDATFVNITTDADGKLYFIIFEAAVTARGSLKNLGSPNFTIQCPMKLRLFLDQYGELGGTHHLGMVTGKRTAEIEKMAKFLRIPTHVIR